MWITLNDLFMKTCGAQKQLILTGNAARDGIKVAHTYAVIT